MVIKENQSGQTGEINLDRLEQNIIYNDITPESQIAPYVQVETPFGGVGVDTGNMYLDGAIIMGVFILVGAFIFGKYFR